ncbi:HAMP domain-containing sensor histidine kinase [Pseudofrankia sp. BMG5.36]|uniref:sensor histidine kinase n=1 Tax=Pseudofrankia sp. BMG5.36 TaxID=1834512 RepID=UPI0008D8EBC8|nr:HAMP domain-containing sensor histidine kinase [Pseudofrankia sp. BMG5.36]OHV56853.1 two-component sensor histidine kinase [Pseudofrankia sp. BMG5.36]
MSKRILAIQLLLTALLMICVCIPLGMDAAQHDRTLLALRTAASADAYAAEVKWRRLGTDAPRLPDQSADAGSGAYSEYGEPGDSQSEVVRPDDDLALYSPDGRLTASSGQPIPLTAAQIAAARERRVELAPSGANGHRQVVVTPVNNSGGLLTILVVARSDSATRAQIQHRWVRLIVGFGVAHLVALALSVLLARWVNRPLRRLERAAARLGDGELSARARAVGGPAEVRQLATSFDAMAGQIEELVDGQRAFLADVSHQIRTPLTAMRLRLELLGQDLADDPAAAGEVGGTIAEVHRLSRMVDGLLAMARTQARGGTSVRVSVRVDRVVRERVATWCAVAAAAHVELLDETTASDRALLTPGHLEQVLDNLLSNALEATASGGRVVVRAALASPDTVTTSGSGNGGSSGGNGGSGRRGGVLGAVRAHEAGGQARASGAAPTIRLTVADDGPGMTAAARAGAFERFRAERPAERAMRADRRGHGLGLAVVHALVVADGGRVRLDEAESGGLLVVLDLPAAPAGPRPGLAGGPDRAEVAGAGGDGTARLAGVTSAGNRGEVDGAG